MDSSSALSRPSSSCPGTLLRPPEKEMSGRGDHEAHSVCGSLEPPCSVGHVAGDAGGEPVQGPRRALQWERLWPWSGLFWNVPQWSSLIPVLAPPCFPPLGQWQHQLGHAQGTLWEIDRGQTRGGQEFPSGRGQVAGEGASPADSSPRHPEGYGGDRERCPLRWPSCEGIVPRGAHKRQAWGLGVTSQEAPGSHGHLRPWVGEDEVKEGDSLGGTAHGCQLFAVPFTLFCVFRVRVSPGPGTR